MTLLFTLGYIGIFVEEIVGLNKSGVALLMAVSLWTIHSDGAGGPVRHWLLPWTAARPHRSSCKHARTCRHVPPALLPLTGVLDAGAGVGPSTCSLQSD